MKVVSLKTVNFRNLEDAELKADDGINIIYGNNAQGKTNLLEAIWLFTGSKSFRNAKDGDFIRFGEKNAKIALKFKSGGRTQNASITFGDEKQAVLNKEVLASTSKLTNKFSAVIFAPKNLDLISDGPAVRRKFLDNILSQLKPKYSAALADYNKAVQQRSGILRDAKYHSDLLGLLDVFEQQAAVTASYITDTRRKFVEYMLPVIKEHYSGISKNRESIDIIYELSSKTDDISPEGLMKAYVQSRSEDMLTGNTSVGPHRDDLSVLINGVSARNFASQGQQRSAVLAMKLGEAHTIKNFLNEQPVALLDDIMSELDPIRKKYILNCIKDWQVFITCCEKKDLRGLDAGGLFYMKQGSFTKKTPKVKKEEN